MDNKILHNMELDIFYQETVKVPVMRQSIQNTYGLSLMMPHIWSELVQPRFQILTENCILPLQGF